MRLWRILPTGTIGARVVEIPKGWVKDLLEPDGTTLQMLFAVAAVM
jgi:hypothetical protein